MHTTPFGWSTTADDVIAGIDLHGIRAVVTGASSGIGAETARALASAGAQVTLAVRNLGAGNKIGDAIRTAHADSDVHVAALDLADPASVQSFAATWSGPLHLLINNAGVMALSERTVDGRGNEMQFATNHLGHFALTVGLHRALADGAHDSTATSGPLGGARVVSLSSRGHLWAPVDFDDTNFLQRAYDPMLAYGQSKTANVLFAVEANRQWASDGITANAVHPGAILETNLSRHMPEELLRAVSAANRQGYKTTAQGAATSVMVAASPALAGVGGRYFEDCRQSEVIPPDADDIASHASGVAWYAIDGRNARRLWELSERLVAVRV
ncbi:MAG: hypothetical protein JWP55_2125 [Mycobacterium sp.]|nr:hypothetical protein [Mycobacterium sp.]